MRLRQRATRTTVGAAAQTTMAATRPRRARCAALRSLRAARLVGVGLEVRGSIAFSAGNGASGEGSITSWLGVSDLIVAQGAGSGRCQCGRRTRPRLGVSTLRDGRMPGHGAPRGHPAPRHGAELLRRAGGAGRPGAHPFGRLAPPPPGTPAVRPGSVLEGPEQTAVYFGATTDEEWRRQSRRWEGLRRAPVVLLAYSCPDLYVARYGEPDKGDQAWAGMRRRGRSPTGSAMPHSGSWRSSWVPSMPGWEPASWGHSEERRCSPSDSASPRDGGSSLPWPWASPTATTTPHSRSSGTALTAPSASTLEGGEHGARPSTPTYERVSATSQAGASGRGQEEWRVVVHRSSGQPT